MTGSTIAETLFDTIEYQDEKSLGIFLDNLKKEQSLFVIQTALIYCHRNGLFSLKESEAVSKSIRVLSQNL